MTEIERVRLDRRTVRKCARCKRKRRALAPGSLSVVRRDSPARSRCGGDRGATRPLPHPYLRPGSWRSYGEDMSNANTLAAALTLATGKTVHAVCVHCLNAADPHEEHYARMIPAGGDCELCSFSDPGYRGARRDASDMFVTTNPNLPACPVQALTLHVVQMACA